MGARVRASRGLAAFVSGVFTACGPPAAPPSPPVPVAGITPVPEVDSFVGRPETPLAGFDTETCQIAAVRLAPAFADPAGSVTFVIHDEMSSGYRLRGAALEVDGATVFTRTAEDRDGHEGSIDEPVVGTIQGRVEPGEHTVRLLVALHNHPWRLGFGYYPILYCYRVRSTHRFTMTGEAKTIDISIYERGGPTTPLAERPGVRFDDR
jgi:hypothetical protein